MNKAVAIIVLITLFLMAPFVKKYAHSQEADDQPKLEMRDHLMIIHEDMGGPMATYMIRYSQMRQEHIRLAIDGECDSSCTLFFGYLPTGTVCATENAKLGFHRASRPEGTMVMMMNYPHTIVLWLLAEGITEDIKYLPTPIMNVVIPRCPDDLLKPPLPEGSEKVD